jgi:diaminohydroxyphosphoribosylaminopyrimidine deaminase/5-amino-6-(5-phosphoribosylamino)uracil reductase
MHGRNLETDERFMRPALELAARGHGFTSPNPCVGAVLVRGGKVVGRGFHRQAGKAHAEIEALRDAQRSRHSSSGTTLYVTLEPCSTHGRTPPCTDAILAAGIRRVVVAATDPNPRHAGRGLRLLQRHGVAVTTGVLQHEAARLNEGFNHWIVRRVPFVTLKSALTLDGRIATATGNSRWITGPAARRHAMNHLRRGADAILVGINTVLADNPALTYRGPGASRKAWRRIILDAQARTPVDAGVVTDARRDQTLIVVSTDAPAGKVAALRERVAVVEAPCARGRIDLPWLLQQLGNEGVTSLLVEGGGEVNAAFLQAGLAQRVAFYFAPRLLGGRDSRTAIAGENPDSISEAWNLTRIEQVALGRDWLVTGLIRPRKSA